MEGNWQGTLKVSAFELRLAFHVTPSKTETGTLTATFDSIDQGATGLPVDAVALAGDGTVTFTLKTLASTYQGKVNPEGTRIVGTWTQGGVKMPLTLKKTDKLAVAPGRRRPSRRSRTGPRRCLREQAAGERHPGGHADHPAGARGRSRPRC